MSKALRRISRDIDSTPGTRWNHAIEAQVSDQSVFEMQRILERIMAGRPVGALASQFLFDLADLRQGFGDGNTGFGDGNGLFGLVLVAGSNAFGALQQRRRHVDANLQVAELTDDLVIG